MVIGLGRRLKGLMCRAIAFGLSRRVTLVGDNARVRFKWPIVPVRLVCSCTARIEVHGVLTIEPWLQRRTPVVIHCASDSVLSFEGDFTLGSGVRLYLSRASTLTFGGRGEESGSGITENSLIMVRKRVKIGKDFICAWNVFITDCDWHTIRGKSYQEDTVIEDHVWVAPNSCILKGSHIGRGSIVGAGAAVHRLRTGPNSLIAGVPARVVARNQNWTRDLESPAQQ